MNAEVIDKTRDDLKQSYESFFLFSLDLIKTMDKRNNHLKFAVVNMQIALELFLKYYFLTLGKSNLVFKKQKNPNKIEFKDFSQILDGFFKSDCKALISKKKPIQNILDVRNAIVHKGMHNGWNDELAKNLINCTLFIQGVLNKEFGESLIPVSHDNDNEFARNIVWRAGAESFAANLAELHNADVYECFNCYSHAMVDKKLFTFDEYNDEGFQCLSCLMDLQLDTQIGLCECKQCGEHTFIVDCLNEQQGRVYNGLCLNCGMNYFAYKCDHCENFFIDFDNERIIDGDYIFCSERCKDNQI